MNFIIYSVNNHFRMNNEKFFRNKKDLVSFLFYYKFIIYSFFLMKKIKVTLPLSKFNFNLHLNYLLYSIYYFLKFYLLNNQNFESKEVVKNNFFYGIFSKFILNYSNSFYKIKIFNPCTPDLHFKQINIGKAEIPLHLFCLTRVNFKALNDSQFSRLLNYIRLVYKFVNRNKNSFSILKKIVKKSIPLSKIIYQRRGRNLIPLMDFVYSQDIRNSLGIKHIYSQSNLVSGISQSSYEKKLIIYLLDILILKNADDFIYQSDKDSVTRKEAYNRGYLFKTLKAKSTNL